MSLLDDAPRPPAGGRPLRYQTVIDLVDEIIRTQDLQPGSLLPTQKELAGLAGVSLITVRRALEELEREGRVAGHQGVGTFVAQPRIVSEPARRGGLLATLAGRADAAAVSTEVLKVRDAEPDAAVARALGLAPGARVWVVSRLRRIDGRPMVLEQARVPQALAPHLDRWRDDLAQSLYGLLARRYGLVDDYEEQYLEVDVAGGAERRRLGAPGARPHRAPAGRELRGRRRPVRLLRARLSGGGVRLLHLRAHLPPPAARRGPRRLAVPRLEEVGVSAAKERPGDGDGIFVGLDLGTSSLKGVALDAAGHAFASEREPYETARPGPGRAEQDPWSWTEAARQVLSRLAASVPPEHWQAVGLSGMIPTVVTLDEAGLPIGPALTWEDCRAQAEAGEIVWQSGKRETYEQTGQPLDGRYLLPMFAWMQRHDPSRAARTATLLSAKDYLFAWLTGHVLTDPSTATGYGCYGLERGAWLPHLAAVAGVAPAGGRAGRPGLPPVVPSAETRPLLPDLAEALGLPAGLPVCVGAADSVLAAEALGAVDPGTVAYVWGTSTVILGASTELTLDPDRRCLVTPLAVEGWGVEMDLVSTGAAVAWLARLLGFGPGGQADVVTAAAAAEDGGVPIALPFVGVGEQGALWDNDVRGTLVGLDLSHGPGDVARAMLDGIILESRRCLTRLQRPRPAGRRGARRVARRRPVVLPPPRRALPAARCSSGTRRRPRRQQAPRVWRRSRRASTCRQRAQATSAMSPTRRRRPSGTGAGRSTRTYCVRSGGSTASGRPSPGSGEAPQ